MADTADTTAKSKIDAAAEKAYAEAAAKTSPKAPVAKGVAEAVEADAPKAEAKVEAVKEAVAAPAKKAPAKKTAAKKAPAKKAPAKKTTAKRAPAKASPPKAASPKKTPAKKAAPAAAKTKTAPNPVTKLKDTIMATAKTTDFTATVKDFATDMQERVKAAYGKTGELAGEVGEFNKANLDAMVESGKIFFTGAQDLVRDNVETGKTVVETLTEDAKKMASMKSPTELMQFQGEIARRNFDAIVSFGSQRTEAWLKLYNDAFAPISNRVSVATEKMTKAA
ncbi:phasin family protein [Erythrobacter sp.]|uniref:phasin family protein n=1 Tax=Erythrobacter sp. TaxID=1042 RepID=UPI001425EF9E|nr:phasin family protein [Erythrobacter sp.]QIQ87945.1 MAG: phasin family protein [Erythrobacter sp.]